MPKFKNKNWSVFFLFILILAILIGYGMFAIPRVQEPLPKWLEQAAAMRQVGLILLAYLNNHNDMMPKDIDMLKKWADSDDNFRSQASSSFWFFTSPKDNKIQSWKIGEQSKGIYLYAPEIRAEGDMLPRRLVLIRPKINHIQYEFMKESNFEKLRLN